MGVPSAARWLLSWIADPELGLDEIDQREWERKNLFLIPRTSAARSKSSISGTAAVAAAAAAAATSGKATLVVGGRHHSQHHHQPGRSTSLPSYVNGLSSAKAAVRPQPPGSYGSYGRIGKSLVPALEPPIERQEEEDAAVAQDDVNSSNRGVKRARSAKAEVAAPKRRSTDRLPQPPRTVPAHAARSGSAPRTVSSSLQPRQPPPVASRHQPTRPPRQPQQLPPWQRSDSFTADVADLSEAAFAHSPASGHMAPAASRAAGPSSDCDVSSDGSGEQLHLQQPLSQRPPCPPPGQLAPHPAPSRSAARAHSFAGVGAGGGGGAPGGTVSSKQLQLRAQPGSQPAPRGAALSELLDESVRELGGLSLLARQSAPAALQTGCAATVAALNESLSASCLQCMNDSRSDGGDDTAAGAAHGGLPALQTMLSAASLRRAAPAAPPCC